jgi:cell volume regulation protein A
MLNEPHSTALHLLVFALLLGASALFSRISGRLGVPVVLVFLGLGMLAGSGGLGGAAAGDYQLAFRVGTAGLALILFDGGLNTSVRDLRRVVLPAGLLATAGVALTAGFAALGARLVGLGWTESMVLGAVVSSTDAAAVFSILRGRGVTLKKRVTAVLELESGINDPLAVILTVLATEVMSGGAGARPAMLLQIPVQFVVGGALGAAIGWGARRVFLRAHLAVGGLYTVLSIAVAFLAFGLPTLVWGSGFLAVYVAGMVLGNGPIPYRAGILRVHDAIAWLSQITMFLMLGLLVSPARLAAVAPIGLALGLMLVLVARPAAVLLCLAPFSLSLNERLLIAWVGLRGAVPVVLASYPVLAGLAGAQSIFDLVFFIVVVSTLLVGATIKRAVRLLRLDDPSAAVAPALLEITSTQLLVGEIHGFIIDPLASVAGARVSELPFPEGAAAMLIVRAAHLIAPKGRTVIEPGDAVYVFCRPEDRAFISLLFGREQEE